MNRKRHNLQGQVVGLEAEKNHLVNENEKLKEAVDREVQENTELKEEIERLNNIINELEKYIHNELILDFYDEDMPCELIINKMENMINELKGDSSN